jgi:DNA replication protein DnaC
MARRVRDRTFDPGDDPSRWRLALQAANLPERYWTADPLRVPDPAVRTWLLSTLENAATWMANGTGLYVNGPLNTGKSSVGAICLMEAVRRCERGMWLPVREVPSCKFRETPESAALYDRTRAADFLVLDDLGAEAFKRSNAAGAALEEIVRHFYDRKRPIVFTSNVAWSELAARYGGDTDPLVSVIRRMVVPMPLYTPWPENPHGR